MIGEITEAGPCLRDSDFRDQIRRVADASAPLIAEGFVRFTPDEFVRYLRMARGEIAEVQSKLETARRRAYFPPEQQARAVAIAGYAMAVTTLLLKSKLPLLKKRRKPKRQPT